MARTERDDEAVERAVRERGIRGKEQPKPKSTRRPVAFRNGSKRKDSDEATIFLLMLKGHVYIGSSLNMLNRVAQHPSNGGLLDQAFYVAIEGEPG